jgi:DNA polymerase III delta prime subunit
MMLVKGVAGSGKTTLISNFIKHYLKEFPLRRIACTATTNKAVKVLVSKIPIQESDKERIVFSTIHKRLGLKESVNEFGEQLFLPDFENLTMDNNYHTIIVDECSMISSKKPSKNNNAASLWENLVEFAERFNVKVIYVGDFCQIPPVGEEQCVLDKLETIERHNIQVEELTKVVRQAQGSPIIQISTFVREHQNYALLTYDYKTVETEQGNIYICSRDNVIGVKTLIHGFVTSELFKENSDYFRLLAWTNNKIKSMNQMIREMIYGDAAKKETILVGERLIADKPIIKIEPSGYKTVLYTTSDEFEVLKVDKVQSHGKMDNASDTFWVYRVVVKGDDNEVDAKQFDIIHPDSAYHYEAFLSGIKRKAIESRDKNLWRWFYSIQDRFAQVAYQYALTVHKSQGSTFKIAMVIERDIFMNRKVKERNQILYTAYTRPSESLYIVR